MSFFAVALPLDVYFLVLEGFRLRGLGLRVFRNSILVGVPKLSGAIFYKDSKKDHKFDNLPYVHRQT